MTLDEHFALIVEEHRQSLAAPLSARKVLLVAVLLDHFADRVFASFRTSGPEIVADADDLPAWRAHLASRSRALATIFALCSGRSDAPRLRLDAVEVPISDYPALSIEDFMVSLYNQNTVQRVIILASDGTTFMAHDTLRAAMAYWDGADWH